MGHAARLGICLLALVLLDGTEVLGQAARLPYTQRKVLTVTPPGAPAGNPAVHVRHYEHAWYVKIGDLFPAATKFSPDPQTDANYNGFNRDWTRVRPGRRDIVNTAVTVDAKGMFPMGTTFAMVDLNPINNANLNNQTFRVIATPIPNPVINRAEASVTFTSVPAPAANAAYAARYQIDGSVLKEPGLVGYAFSTAVIQYTDLPAVMRNARVNLNPQLAVGRTGTDIPKHSRTWDPVSVTLQDAAGAPLLFADVLSLFTATDDDAVVTWSDTGVAHVETGADGLAGLHVAIDPQFVMSGQGGSLDLEITDGVVTESNKTGRFAGMTLPTLGANLSSWDLAFGSQGLEFDLALDPFVTPQTASIALDSSMGALVEVPEPGSLALIGIGAALLLAQRGGRSAPPTGGRRH